MAKNKGRYLNSHASVTLGWALFLFGVTAWPAVRVFQTAEHRASVRVVRSSASNEIEHVKSWVIERYAALRFVYQVEMQLSELHAEETEHHRKSQSHADHHHLPNQPRFDSSRAGVLALCLHTNSHAETSVR